MRLQDLNKPKQPATVVRLTTSTYKTSKGAFRQTKELRTLKRKTHDFDLLENEMYNQCMEDIIITNLYEVADGVYQLVMVNEGYDWETGCLDEYELKLIPYVESRINDSI